MLPWRAVDHAGEVLDLVTQRRLNPRAVLNLSKQMLPSQPIEPENIAIDELASHW